MAASTGFGAASVAPMQCDRRSACLVKDSYAGLLARGACDTLRQNRFGLECLRKSLPAPMNVTTIPRTSPRLGLRVFVLMLAWVVMAGLSWADLIGVQAESHGYRRMLSGRPSRIWTGCGMMRRPRSSRRRTSGEPYVLYASAIGPVPSSAGHPAADRDLLQTLRLSDCNPVELRF